MYGYVIFALRFGQASTLDHPSTMSAWCEAAAVGNNESLCPWAIMSTTSDGATKGRLIAIVFFQTFIYAKTPIPAKPPAQQAEDKALVP